MIEKPKPTLIDPTDAIIRVALGSICTSDLHIKHGSVPRAVPGITVGHEMVGIVEEVGKDVTAVKVGDRVIVNVVRVTEPVPVRPRAPKSKDDAFPYREASSLQ